MAKILQIPNKKGSVIKLAEVKLTSYKWNKLPSSTNLLSLKDLMRLEADRECQLDMQRAFING